MTTANPSVTANLRPDSVTAGLTPERLLIVGQVTVGATAPIGQLVTNILNDGAEAALFGADSPLCAAVRRARRVNPKTRIDAIPLTSAAPSATSAEATIEVVTFLPPAEALPVNITVAGPEWEYALSIEPGDTSTTFAQKIADAINADSTSLFSAQVATDTVTLQCNVAGTFGNDLGLVVEGPSGIFTVSAFSGGTIDPATTATLDVVGSTRYQGIAWQFNESVEDVAEFLDARFNVENDVQDGRAFSAQTSTLSQALAKLSPLNSKNLCLMVDKIIDRADRKGPAVLDVPFLKATEFAAIRALRRTDGAILGDKVIARTALDAFGGIWQNSKPYFNTPLSASLPQAGDTFTALEVDQLVDAGGYIIDANRAGTDVITGAVVTTYKTDPAGNPDITYKFLNYVDTATAAREYIVNSTRAQYPQYRATGGQLINGVDSANEASVATFVAELYSALGDLALVNTGTGTVSGEAVDYDKLFRESLSVTLNPATGRFLVALKLYLVIQFREALYDMAIAFEV